MRRCQALEAALQAAQQGMGLLRLDAEAATFQISILEAEKAALSAKYAWLPLHTGTKSFSAVHDHGLLQASCEAV